MKAIRFREPGGPEVLEWVDLPDPVAGPGQVLVEAAFIGVGKPDILMRKGTYRWMPPLPAIPGNEMAGHVVALGEGVSGFCIGQPVLVSSRNLPRRGGCYAQRIAVPAEAAIALPEGIDLDAAVTIPNYQLAFALLAPALDSPRAKTVFIQGAAGGVAGAVIDICKAHGLQVIGSASTDRKCAFAKAQGADHVINYSTQNVVEQVMELTRGRGADLILDHVGAASFLANFDMLASLGTIVSFNVLGGLPSGDVFAKMREHLPKSPTVRCFSMHSYDEDPAARDELTRQAVKMFADGRAHPSIFGHLPLAEAARAHQLLESGEVLGKLVLRP